MNAKSILIIIALTTLIVKKSPGADTLENSLLRDIPTWLAEYHVPCAGVGLIEDGRIKWIKVFGVRQKGIPALNNTLFNIASQTKPVTAMLVLKLG